MSKKKYRPKVDKNKSAQHKPFDGAQDRPAPDGNGHRLVNANDFEARKEGIMEVVNRYNAEKEAAERAAEAAAAQPKFDAQFWDRARETISKTAKLIGDEGKAEEARRAEKSDPQSASPKAEEARREEKKSSSESENTAQPKRDELDDWLAGLNDEELKAWRAHGEDLLETLNFRMGGVSTLGSGPLGDEEVSEYLGNGVRLLNQVVVLTSFVLDTIDVEYTRKVVAQDCRPMDMRRALKALGYDPDKLLGTESGGGSKGSGEKTGDHRKGPRGGRHPLIQLITLGATSVRLINQITRGTNPHAHNLLTQQERENRRPMTLMMPGIKLKGDD